MADMYTDREVIEGRGTGSTPSDDEKRNKQKRWQNNQRIINDLWERFNRLDCPRHVGTGWVPADFGDYLNGEYPKFKTSSKSWKSFLPDINISPPDDVWWTESPPVVVARL